MLTSDLLRYTRRGEIYRVNFIDNSHAKYGELADSLLEIYNHAPEEKLSRGELSELTEQLKRGFSNPVIASGLDKLLLDRTEFAPVLDADYPAMRRETFLQSAESMRKGIIIDTQELNLDIYGDLPNFERVQNFKNISSTDLLNRYNLALAQGLMIYAEKVNVSIFNCDAQELRRLMKYLKFFRLLAKIMRPSKKVIQLEISGPYSLFGSNRKYGLQLAEFLPAICRLPEYEVKVLLSGPKGAGYLVLTPQLPLISHYRNFSAYLPEEIRLYHKEFQKRSENWKIVGDTPFIDGGNQELFFPDLSFAHTTGKVVHLELFHRWHSGQLIPRLEWLNTHTDTPLLLGIDRALVHSEETWNTWLETYPNAMKKCWKFRDFPGVETTLKHLNKQL